MGRVKMANMALKQMFKFILRIERMKLERWVKICRKEIKTGRAGFRIYGPLGWTCGAGPTGEFFFFN